MAFWRHSVSLLEFFRSETEQNPFSLNFRLFLIDNWSLLIKKTTDIILMFFRDNDVLNMRGAKWRRKAIQLVGEFFVPIIWNQLSENVVEDK